MIECYLNYIVDVVAVEIYNNDNCAILLLGHELIKPAQTTATYELYIVRSLYACVQKRLI